MKKNFGSLAVILAILSSSHFSQAEGLNLVTVIGLSPFGFRVIFEATALKEADAVKAALFKCAASGSEDCQITKETIAQN